MSKKNQAGRFGHEELEHLYAVITSGRLWRGNGQCSDSPLTDGHGSMVDKFEDEFGHWIGRKYVHAVSSGTAANEAAIASLGLCPGDEVICPAAAPAFVSMSVLATGCIPVFADVDPDTLIIDAESIEARITDNSRAVIVVHLWGQPAPMNAILEVAKRYQLKLVEDCAQAYGSRYGQSVVGTFGSAACFSLQQGKHISCGEGGIFVTDDPDAYKRAVLFSNSGIPAYRYGITADTTAAMGNVSTRGHFAFGHNHRMSELQAAVALAQLPKLSKFQNKRTAFVRIIEEELSASDCLVVQPAKRYEQTTPIYWKYPMRVPSQCGNFKEINYLESIYQRMQKERITPFGAPLSNWVNYAQGSCPNAERGATTIWPISFNHGLSESDIRLSVRQFLSRFESGGDKIKPVKPESKEVISDE